MKGAKYAAPPYAVFTSLLLLALRQVLLCSLDSILILLLWRVTKFGTQDNLWIKLWFCVFYSLNFQTGYISVEGTDVKSSYACDTVQPVMETDRVLPKQCTEAQIKCISLVTD